VDNDIDYIAASFTRKAADVAEIRQYFRQLLADKARTTGDSSWLTRPLPKIISKIESTEALENFSDILAVSDAIMVARGDLAVEIPMETLAAVQREIVTQCNAAGKPVIVATQMLESMQKSPRPTRAECTDVANAVLQGADCVMLSGESAKGKYPVESVTMMRRIVEQTELVMRDTNSTISTSSSTPCSADKEEALAFAAVQLSRASNASGIVLALPSASPYELSSPLPALLAKYRPMVPVFVLVPSYKAGRLLQLHRGVHGVVYSDASVVRDVAAVRARLVASQCVAAGSEMVLITTNTTGDNNTNLSLSLLRL